MRGRVAVVTGASRGVGKGIALALGEAGATVYVTGRSDASGTTEGLPGTVRDTADAVKLLKRRHAEIEGGRFVPDAGRVLFDDLADMVVADYEANGRRSLGTVKNALANLRVAFGGEPALAITTDRITGYVRERQRKPDENTAGAANATIRKELAALRRGFNLAPACRKACPRTPASWPCSGSSARRRRISSAAAGGGGVAGS